MNRRRSGSDRRGWQPMPPVPFLDSEGCPVLWDRRRVADRRLNAIGREWVDTSVVHLRPPRR